MSQALSVVDTTSKVLDVKTSEAVGSTSVSTDGEELGVLDCGGEDIGLEEGDGVGIGKVALIPVIGDLLVAGSVGEVSGFTSNREERLKNVTVKATLGVLGRLVGHESVDKGVRCRLHHQTGEGTVEEVGVLVDTLLESGSTEVGKKLEVVVVSRSTHVVHLLELLDLNKVVVSAEPMSVTSR